VPFGKSPEEGFFFRNHHELEREVLAAVDALRQAFSGSLDPGPLVYTGYSQGATMGALMLVGHGETFPRIALVEGGYSEWNVSIGKKFEASGGQRVLFACGGSGCKTKADASATTLASCRTRPWYSAAILRITRSARASSMGWGSRRSWAMISAIPRRTSSFG
jgi:hypothetical protein